MTRRPPGRTTTEEDTPRTATTTDGGAPRAGPVLPGPAAHLSRCERRVRAPDGPAPADLRDGAPGDRHRPAGAALRRADPLLHRPGPHVPRARRGPAARGDLLGFRDPHRRHGR